MFTVAIMLPSTWNFPDMTFMVKVVGSGIIVEVVMAVAVSVDEVLPLKITSAVRVAKLAVCALNDVVIPVLTLTVHSVSAGSVAEPIVSLNVAFVVPDRSPEAVKVVLPQLGDL
jgi:hypothetical protein